MTTWQVEIYVRNTLLTSGIRKRGLGENRGSDATL